VEGQSITLQPFAEYLLHPLCIVPPLEADDKVIGIADQPGTPAQAWLDLPLEPAVEDMVQVEVAQQRR
jgi:hypothetical protein